MNSKLASKYRPTTWSQVVGQEHITNILSKMVDNGSTLPTGFVFVGTAGSSKTTNARILAKAINCLSDSKPCNECEHCLLFNKLKSDHMPSYPDYLEVDGTTYGGKEDIEQLLDLAQMSPSIRGGKRIILIDEAHRLSAQGWDVLLKPLEEGLAHTIFLFATTEVDKVRGAILSRCPTHVTKPLTQKKLYGYLKYILDSEAIPYDDRSLTLLSYNYAGRTRDAVTELDSHVLAYNSFKDYTEKSVYEYILDAMSDAYKKDIDSAYELTREVISFKSGNIGRDMSETILALHTKNYNLVTKDVLDCFMSLIGNNLSKIIAIYLNNNINTIDKFVLSLCLVAELNKSEVSAKSARRIKTVASNSVSVKIDELASTGKFT